VVVILIFHLSALQASQHRQAQAGIAANRQNAITSCQAANANRTEDVAIWERVLGGGAKNHPGDSPAKLADLARDLQLVHQAYALRDCQALYSTK
jgi:hypothetical protein